MKRLILGVLYCLLWYVSIFVGFFIFICPMLPLVFLHPKLYRKLSETVFGMWEPFPVALMEIFFGIRAILSGDQIDPFERSLLIMNHRTRLDWNFLWIGLFHCCHPYSHALKYVLKSAVKNFPGPGWVMQTCGFIFIYRDWTRDQKLMGRLIRYLDLSEEPYQILIFPEGTDLTENSILKSHKYADEHNYERYYNVLHPKTRGFAFLVRQMKMSGKMRAVYDITVGYPDGNSPQNESDLLKGNFPEEVHFHVKRYSAAELPIDEEELKEWLMGIWKKKEVLLSKFHKVGSFTHLGENLSEVISVTSDDLESLQNTEQNSKTYGNHQNNAIGSNNCNTPTTSNPERLRTPILRSDSFLNRYRTSHLLYLTFLFWMGLIYFSVHQLFKNFYLQMWVLVHTLLFSSISYLTDGFQHVIATLFFYRYHIRSELERRYD